MPWTSDGVTECSIEALWSNNHPIVCVLHATHGADVESPAVARDVLNNWQDHIAGSCMPNNYVLQGLRYRYRGTVDGETGFLAPDPAKPTVGLGTGQACSPNVSRLVHKRIESTAGKRAGRIYLGPWDDAGIDEDGRLDPAVVTAQNVLLAAFLAGLDDSDEARLVVVHGTNVDIGEKDKSPVTALTMDPMIATQRRRLR